MKKWRLMAWEPPLEGQEVECSIQDTETFDFKEAKVILSRSRDKLPDGDEIWIYDAGSGVAGSLLFKEPWFVKVVEIREEEVAEIKVVSKKIALGRMRGTMLETLIRQREEDDKKPG